MIISLCGFMGAGKSTVGKYLAQMLRYDFIDLDQYIENKYNTTVNAFFAEKGEEAFRMEEYNSLLEIIESYSGGKNLVLALGGGTVTRERCSAVIKEKSYGIYLHCSKDELVRRLKRRRQSRPLLRDKSDNELADYVQSLMDAREGAYISSSKCTISTQERQLAKVIDEILAKVEFEV